MKIYALAAAAVCLSGCATVTRGTNDTWTVNTTPAGAAVKTSNSYACDSTPCTFKMPRKSEFDVTITKPGYKVWTGKVTHHAGAMLDLVPNPLAVTLEKEEVHAAN